jgi:hypothetical protein
MLASERAAFLTSSITPAMAGLRPISRSRPNVFCSWARRCWFSTCSARCCRARSTATVSWSMEKLLGRKSKAPAFTASTAASIVP